MQQLEAPASLVRQTLRGGRRWPERAPGTAAGPRADKAKDHEPDLQASVIRPVLPRFRAHEKRTQRLHLPNRPMVRDAAACVRTLPHLRAIKRAGGAAFAQCPGSARFPSMPISTIETGGVDFVLRQDEMAHELARRSRQITLPALSFPDPALVAVLSPAHPQPPARH